MRKLITASLIATAMTTAVFAQAETPSGWQTWSWQGACFAVLYPEDGAIKELNLDKAYASVKHVTAEGIKNSVALVSGFEDRPDLSGVADVDGKVFKLLVFDGVGYVQSGEREDSLISAMTESKSLRVTWNSEKGMVTQTYKLEGLDAARRTIDTACYP